MILLYVIHYFLYVLKLKYVLFRIVVLIDFHAVF